VVLRPMRTGVCPGLEGVICGSPGDARAVTSAGSARWIEATTERRFRLVYATGHSDRPGPVVVAASFGGLAALRQLLCALPADLSECYDIIRREFAQLVH
jgi:chemotaxis response regulator CheB